MLKTTIGVSYFIAWPVGYDPIYNWILPWLTTLKILGHGWTHLRPWRCTNQLGGRDASSPGPYSPHRPPLALRPACSICTERGRRATWSWRCMHSEWVATCIYICNKWYSYIYIFIYIYTSIYIYSYIYYIQLYVNIYIYYTLIYIIQLTIYIYIHIPHISGVKYGYWLWINICIYIYILCIGIFHLSLGYNMIIITHLLSGMHHKVYAGHKLQSSLGSSHCTCRRGQVQQTSKYISPIQTKQRMLFL